MDTNTSAIAAFIDAQRALLARTQNDIAALSKLRASLTTLTRANPIPDIPALTPLAAYAPHPHPLSFLPLHPVANADIEPLRALARAARAKNTPCTTQCMPLSPLQQLVKDARKAVPPLCDEDTDAPPSVPAPSGIKIKIKINRTAKGDKARENEGETEGADETSHPPHITNTNLPPSASGLSTSTSAPASPSPSPSLSPAPVASSSTSTYADPPPTSSTPTPTPTLIHNPPSPGPSRKPSPGPSHKPKRSSASETYKLPWSVAEQHLLERLLEEIGPQERNRGLGGSREDLVDMGILGAGVGIEEEKSWIWSKISLAMHGRRTPRQVASRVQKYREKLSRAGIEG
ncbi:hypothetical protein BJ138DRAFT_1183816 [Hygrophoropsis aurantiaca]|uniref:Uncharacterized protein n=1 Tax=Hygrophoropsis aurantiaca TaxID=72124 RepID=A0ACB7ZW14_9AGAM|nr:hypothetical protein BJ138DRAFT_1183816 [Hygrophoropsis aurantiaca]